MVEINFIKIQCIKNIFTEAEIKYCLGLRMTFRKSSRQIKISLRYVRHAVIHGVARWRDATRRVSGTSRMQRSRSCKQRGFTRAPIS